MIAGRNLRREEVEAHLRDLGYEPTEYRTATGTIWRRKNDGAYVQVPDPDEQGMYPHYIVRGLMERIGNIPFRPLQ